MLSFPSTYIPSFLTKKDKRRQVRILLSSKKMYKKDKYVTHKPVASFKSKPSKHITKARQTYHIESIQPSNELAKKTGCSIGTLRHIIRKGEGAYYSSGSRPNQTPQSWGVARLASALTSGKAAAVDFRLLQEGCDHKKKAFRLATLARKKYRKGRSRTLKVYTPFKK